MLPHLPVAGRHGRPGGRHPGGGTPSSRPLRPAGRTAARTRRVVDRQARLEQPDLRERSPMKGPPWDSWTDCSAATATGGVATRRSTRRRRARRRTRHQRARRRTPPPPVRAGPRGRGRGRDRALPLPSAHRSAGGHRAGPRRGLRHADPGAAADGADRARQPGPRLRACCVGRPEGAGPDGHTGRDASARPAGAHVLRPGRRDGGRLRHGRRMGMGGMLAGGLFASMAGAFVGTAIAEEIFNDDHDNDAGNNDDDNATTTTATTETTAGTTGAAKRRRPVRRPDRQRQR